MKPAPKQAKQAQVYEEEHYDDSKLEKEGKQKKNKKEQEKAEKAKK